jgi:hypothetical protein
MLDEVRIYDNALSDFQICQLAGRTDCYSAVANAEASTYGGNSRAASGSFNALALLLVPIGAVIFLRIWRRKR